MKLVNKDLLYSLLIFFISAIFVFDLFSNVGRAANGDGLIHTVVPNIFSNAIRQGNFPVGWTDGFANYGLPLGTVSQQLSTYLTAFITIFTHNPVMGFNVVVFLGVFLSSIFLYYFLRIYFSAFASFIGVFLFTFTPYRILNVYIRGALPEFFAGIFFPLLLIAVYQFIVKKRLWGLFLFIVSFALLTLAHPFMDIVVMFLVIPYILFLFISTKSSLSQIIKNSIILLSGCFLGILLTSYYTIPLLLEIKYFYYGETSNHLTPNNYLSLSNFLFYKYSYFTSLDIFNRGFIVNVGLIESIVMIVGAIYVGFRTVTKKLFYQTSLIDFSVISGLILIFMMSSFANTFYTHINILSNVQFPWRMLSAFIFVPPMLIAFFVSKINIKSITLLIVVFIAFFAFPQLYGKNYTVYPTHFYDFTSYNLDAVVMNTIWTGDSNTYPIASVKASIIEGKGNILSQNVSNAFRTYTVRAQTPLKLVDYTFYFPGWKVFVDNINTPIEYQNPNYRGVITYVVPPGQHTIIVKYTDTKIRQLGKLLTIIFAGTLLILFIFYKPLKNFLV